MHRITADLRYALRMLAKTPTATVTVLLALSLGIGLSALTFTMIYGMILPTIPVEGGDRIVRISREEPLARTVEDYPTWAERQRSFEEIGAAEMTTVTLSIEGRGSEPISAASITPSILPLLATPPSIGRPFTEADAAAGAPAVVLIGHSVWQDRLGGSPDVLGTVVRVNGTPAEVIGVMPEEFGFPWDHQLWSPLEIDPARGSGTSIGASAESGVFAGRLREGVSRQDAAAELSALTAELDRELKGETGPQSTVRVTPFTDIFSEPGASAALSLLMLGVAFLVLLVACANVTNVLLARAVARRRELAVRVAIGASRMRIAGQVLLEISLLAAAGAAAGAVIAIYAGAYIEAVMPPGMPYWIHLEVDWAVLAFVAFLAILAALMAGLLPALQASRANTHELLKDDSRGSSSFRTGRLMRRLIGVEMALSFVLLVVAGLFIRSASNFSATDFAFAPEEVYTARIGLPDAGANDPAARAIRAEEVLRTVALLPEVQTAALSNAVPAVGSAPTRSLEIEGAGGAPAVAGVRAKSVMVTSEYFSLFRAPIVTGRNFDTRDRVETLPVAVVNESFVRTHLPGGALDRRIRVVGADGADEWLTVVGVVPDLMSGGVEGEVPEAFYRPVSQTAPASTMLLVRPNGTFASLPTPIRESIAAIDPDIALYDIVPLERVIYMANSQYTWMSILFAISGGIALFLAAIGLYGVMAFWVVQRTREIGVRMALGGDRSEIVRLVLGQGMRQISIGLGVGIVLAVIAAQLLRSILYGVAPTDPLVFGSIIAVLVAAAWLGCWIPARRATRIDPLKALAAE